MCGRYVSATPPAELAEQLGVTDVRAEDLGPRFNVAPTLDVYAVAENRDGERRLGTMRWGLVPSWAKDPKIGSRMINARAEDIETKPAFRNAIVRRRCLIPADGFYEWLRDGKRKRPFYITRADGTPMTFAGLWEVWKDDDDPDPDGGWLRTCTIVTTEANDAIASLHDRMPVILEPKDWDLWLDRSVQDASKVRALLKPLAPEAVRLNEVQPLVNNVNNEGPELLEPVDDGTTARADDNILPQTQLPLN